MSSEEDEETREVMVPAGGADYLLNVTGDSMTGAGIIQGDLLLVRAQQVARDGQIVVAHLSAGGEVVKRLRRDPDENSCWLDSESADGRYEPILLDSASCIQGIFVGLIRDC
jgi:repressor LexA